MLGTHNGSPRLQQFPPGGSAEHHSSSPSMYSQGSTWTFAASPGTASQWKPHKFSAWLCSPDSKHDLLRATSVTITLCVFPFVWGKGDRRSLDLDPTCHCQMFEHVSPPAFSCLSRITRRASFLCLRHKCSNFDLTVNLSQFNLLSFIWSFQLWSLVRTLNQSTVLRHSNQCCRSSIHCYHLAVFFDLRSIVTSYFHC